MRSAGSGPRGEEMDSNHGLAGCSAYVEAAVVERPARATGGDAQAGCPEGRLGQADRHAVVDHGQLARRRRSAARRSPKCGAAAHGGHVGPECGARPERVGAALRGRRVVQRERPGVGARGAGMISSAARCRGGDRDREPVARERGGREPRRGRPRALCRGHDEDPGGAANGRVAVASSPEPMRAAAAVRNQRSAGPRQVDCDRPAGRIDAVHRHAGRAVGHADVGRKRPRAQHGADGLAADGRRDGHRCSRRGDLAAVERARRDRSRPQGAAVGDLRRPAGRQIAADAARR